MTTSKVSTKIIIPILVGSAVGVALAVSIFFIKLSFDGKFSPGTSVAGIDLSYKTPVEAMELLSVEAEKYLDEDITVKFDAQNFVATPREMGVEILAKETIKTLQETDAGELSIFELLLNKGREPQKTSVIVGIDYSTLSKKLDKEFELSEIAPKGATFYFDEKSKLQIQDAKSGVVIDKEKFTDQFRLASQKLKAQDFNIEFETQVPEITSDILRNQEPAVKESLQYQFTLVDPVYSDNWDLSLSEHLDWVHFVEKEEYQDWEINKETLEKILTHEEEQKKSTHIGIEIDQNKLNEFIDAEISKWLDIPADAINLSIDEEGRVVIEGTGQDGIKVQREHMKQAIELAVESRVAEVPIPVIKVAAEINISEDLQELGIKEKIGVGHTSYYGSPSNRIHNIKMGSSKFNGALIAPDEIFSFNKTLGPVDGSTGYKKELVIKSDGTKPEYGGGICQVSTTTYRAVLLSGLPIVERNQHSYAVSYYSQILGHGLDATIYLGGPDLRFTNDTGHHILIATHVRDDYELYVTFFGTSDGRSVELEGPYLSNYHSPGPTEYIDTTEIPPGEKKQVEKAHTGFNALWYRYITDINGKTEAETILTKYRAIPAKILVGVEEGEMQTEEVGG